MSMSVHRAFLAGLCAIVVSVAACGPGEAPPTGASSRAGTFAEYAAASCSALQSIWRAYGNPDTGSYSPLQQSFMDAVDSGDVVAVDAAAAEVRAELERGRAAAVTGAGWPPGAESMLQMERLLLAMEAMLEATRAATPMGFGEATSRGQAAFEAAAGVEAWRGMLTGLGSVITEAGESWPPCEGVPIS